MAIDEVDRPVLSKEWMSEFEIDAAAKVAIAVEHSRVDVAVIRASHRDFQGLLFAWKKDRAALREAQARVLELEKAIAACAEPMMVLARHAPINLRDEVQQIADTLRATALTPSAR